MLDFLTMRTNAAVRAKTLSAPLHPAGTAGLPYDPPTVPLVDSSSAARRSAVKVDALYIVRYAGKNTATGHPSHRHDKKTDLLFALPHTLANA